MKNFFLQIIAVFITSLPISAQDNTAELDKIFAWAKTDTPGCGVAVSQNGKLVFNRSYGSADLERDVPINSNTTFDSASVSKQFVAASVLLLVEDGKLSLTEDIHK